MRRNSFLITSGSEKIRQEENCAKITLVNIEYKCFTIFSFSRLKSFLYGVRSDQRKPQNIVLMRGEKSNFKLVKLKQKEVGTVVLGEKLRDL